ncbi:MAG TPA: iron ABC transporter permease [Methylomirabilota bacterium]|nr:iron ABC transporter permease [Methylomirabilota bacterium]
MAAAWRSGSTVWGAGAVAVAALVAAPLLVVVASLRRPAVDVWVHLWRTQLVELLVNTGALVAAVGAGTLVLGAGLGWLVVAYGFPGRRLFEWALALPLALPAYVIGFAFLGLLDFAGPVQTALRGLLGESFRLPGLPSGAGVALMMTLVFYPYVYLLARAAFAEHGLATLEAARTLGRSRARAFLAVVLPMARPSLTAGASLAMMESLADFGTVSTFGYRTLTEAVFRVWTGMFDRAAATQIACLLLFFALALLAAERASRGRRRFVQSQRHGTGVPAARLRGWRAAAATGACAAVLGLGFVVPVVQLAVWAVGATGHGLLAVDYAGAVTSSFLLAGAAAGLIGLLALGLAYARRMHPTAVVRAATQFAAIGYAVPGAVIATGVLVAMAGVERALGRATAATLGQPADVLLVGSAAGLLFAYAVRFLAVGFQSVDSSLAKIPAAFDEAARSLGASVAGTLQRVHLPLLQRGLLTALVLVLVDALKELPATLLLRPLGLTTLAIEVWQRTSESLWAEAALPALTIVAVGVVPVLLVTRLTAPPAR